MQNILNSVRDAGEQLLRSSSYGAAAIEISLGKNAQVELQQVLNGLPKLMESMPHVSAVILFIEQLSKNDKFVSKKTAFYGYLNPTASNKLPGDIEKILREGDEQGNDELPSKSLLDD